VSNLPTGIITFLFTDIEGSTQLWEQYPALTRAALVRHDELIETVVSRYHGDLVRPRGEGDSRFAVFSLASDAVAAAAAIQQALYAETWTTPTPVRVRMALHTGEADLRDGDYYGSAVNRCARLRSAGHGGQILLSEVTCGLVRDALPPGTQLRDMGEHRLKDLIRSEHIYQLVVPDPSTGSGQSLPSEFPPLKTLDTQPNNLPVQLTSLVGRERELEVVSSLLRRQDVHLLTLTGPGGTGKTRLSLRVGAELLDEYPDGVWFVELAALTDSTLVVSEIANTLGVAEQGSRPVTETLKGYLREKHLLLILDNFEQITGAAPQVGQLLQATPHVKVLVTSRVPLRVRGEKEYAVPTLSVPDPHRLPSLDKLTQYEAVRLFIERAADVKPDFEITNDNAPAVAEICVQLDGLPLAIELAAARIKMLPPEALLPRLSHRLKLLTGGARDLPTRHQTLRNTIEWSYDLLSEGEKQLFLRMASFSGGRTLQAMEEVCNYDGELQIDVLDGVQSLLDKSLLQLRAGERGGDGEPRFWMLETIHEYAREKLEESGEAEALYREHAQYFLKLVEEAEPHLAGSGQGEWLDRLEEENDNVRAALRWARDSTREEDRLMGLRIGGALYLLWEVRGYLTEGREQLAAALTGTVRITNVEGSRARGNALFGAGKLALRQGDYEAQKAYGEEALAAYRLAGDKVGIANATFLLAILAQQRGEYDRARTMNEESLAILREVGDKLGIAFVLLGLGIVAYLQGEYDRARTLYEESLPIVTELGQVGLKASLLNDMANVAYMEGDFEHAHALHTESLRMQSEKGYTLGVPLSLGGVGEAAIGLGKREGKVDLVERGVVLLGASDALNKELGAVMAQDDLLSYQHAIKAARAVLGEESFERLRREGWAMSREQAIEHALEAS
jgi:predicted ATPase/class 3 adenylate cyclase